MADASKKIFIRELIARLYQNINITSHYERKYVSIRKKGILTLSSKINRLSTTVSEEGRDYMFLKHTTW